MSGNFKFAKTIAYWRKRVEDQTKWVEEHGGSRGAYVERYGSQNDADHYGSGGEAIWAADRAELDSLILTLKHWESKVK